MTVYAASNRTIVTIAPSTPSLFSYTIYCISHPFCIYPYVTVGAYLDRSKAGYLSPEIQIRNLKLFGYVSLQFTPDISLHLIHLYIDGTIVYPSYQCYLDIRVMLWADPSHHIRDGDNYLHWMILSYLGFFTTPSNPDPTSTIFLVWQVTSEGTLRDEHDRFMTTKRQMLWPELQQLTLESTTTTTTTTTTEQSKNQI